MNQPSRESIFTEAAKRMRADFEDARQNIPHAGEKGSEGEAILRKFLNEHMPGRFQATTGFIIDKKDGISGQEDVIVYDHLNCPVYKTMERGRIIPNDNVAAVIEVKFKLDGAAMVDAFSKIHQAKGLAKSALTPGEEDSPLMGTTFGALFAFESVLKPETVVDQWHALLSETNPLHNSCSIIVVLDKGIFFTAAEVPGHGFNPAMFQGPGKWPVGTKLGIGYMELGQNALDSMLRLLLAHLTFFRHRVDHPGFKFGAATQTFWLQVGEVDRKQSIIYSLKPKEAEK
jgi:hypothetical protein